MGVRAGPEGREGGAAISVRGSALGILTRVDRGGAYADILLDRAQRKARFRDPRDRALLTELVMGTLRRRGALDFTLSPHLSRPLEKTDPLVRNALRLGAYQLLYTRVPDRVALFETVAAVKEIRGVTPAGFVNAVLRGILRAGKEALLPAGEGPPREAVRVSAPLPLLEALSAEIGIDEAAPFLAAALDKPPFAVRANPFKTSREALLARLGRAGMDPSPCRYAPDGIVLGEPGAVHGDPGFLSGEYFVMDEGAQLIAPLLSPRSGEEILDACAAPGGKATHLAALAEGKARIVATDVSEGRVGILREAVSRSGAPDVEIRTHDYSAGPLPGCDGRFDKVLVDAPCTGMGVIRRNPDAKWRFRPDHRAEMAALQLAILKSAWTSLRSGGLLAYCTCTPFREENESVVEAFLASVPDAAAAEAEPGERRGRGAGDSAERKAWPGPPDARTSEGYIRLWPHRHGTDGFFAALLRKAGGGHGRGGHSST